MTIKPGRSQESFTRRAAAAVAGAGLLMLALSIARADDSAAVTRLMNDPAFRQRVVDSAKRSTVLLQNPCPDARLSIESEFGIYKPGTVDDHGRVTSGSWRMGVDEKGCGGQRRLNVLVSISGATVAVTPMLPGTTHADPVLQNDAVHYASLALRGVPGGLEPNCNIGYVADTEFLREEPAGPSDVRGGWRETWTLVSCAQKMVVPMLFIRADDGGTDIAPGGSRDIRILPLAPKAGVPAGPSH